MVMLEDKFDFTIRGRPGSDGVEKWRWYGYFGESVEDFDDVFGLETDAHGGVERVFGQEVFVHEGWSGSEDQVRVNLLGLSMHVDRVERTRKGGKGGEEVEDTIKTRTSTPAH